MIIEFKEEKGLSLVEVTVAMTILVLLLTMTSSLFLQSMSYWKRSNQDGYINGQLRLAVNRISREFRGAQSFSLPTGSNQEGNPAHKLEFTNMEGQVIEFSVDAAGNLKRIVDGEAETIVARQLNSIDAFYISSKCVEVVLYGTSSIGTSIELSTKISCRVD